ncbi:MAG: quinol:cytochrome C oxidoreductase [Planctomycetota bacterium]
MTATMTAPPIDQVAPAVVTRVREGDLKTGQTALLGLGALLLVVAFATGLSSDPARFYFSYLTGYMGVLGIALCALFFTMLQHITRAGWSGGVRRVAENICGALPLMLVLFVPILIGFDHLFGHWSHAELDPARPDFDAIVAGKSVWLNKPFFMARVAVYFGIWIGLATWFRRQSAKQDETGDPNLSLKMSRLAAPGLLLFALSITFAAFDWIMSLDPHWFSTMFGICYFAGGFMSFLAFTILFARWLGTKGYLKEAINTEHYHDLGKLMFAFMVFWTYVNFSQYMLIWYANLPEETTWYMNRLHGGWGAVGTLLVFGHFLVPFAYLMSRHIKRNPIALGVGAAYLLVIHWIDMQYLILPNASHGHGGEHAGEHAAAAHGGADSTALFGHFSDNLGDWMHGLTLGDVLCYVGMLSLLAGAAVFFVRRNNLLPTRDPRLLETLSFQNI